MQRVVHKIVITGNKRTLDRIILEELTFKADDTITDSDISESRQNLMNTELFSDVHFRESDVPKKGMVDVEIHVKEKWSILPLPYLARTSDAENRLGMRYQDFNLTGRGHYLEIKVINKWANDFKNNLGVFYSARLETKNFLKTHLNIAPAFSSGKTLEQTFADGTLVSEYNKDIKSNDFIVSHEFGYFEVGAAYSNRVSSYEFLSGLRQPFNDSKIISLGAFIGYDRVNNLGNYIFDGYRLMLSMSNSNKLVGSDINAMVYGIDYNRFILMNGKNNLAYRVKGTVITGDASEDILATVGGSTSLRGYENAEFEGDRAIQMNSEYRFPLTPRYWGGTFFMDGGNAWSEGSSIKLSDLHWSAGIGIRLFIKQLVRGVGRLDWAYNLSRKEYKLYMGAHHTF